MIRPDFKPGDRLSAHDLNEIMAALQRLESPGFAAPLASESGPTGSAVSMTQPSHFWIKLTGGGTGGIYAWTRMLADVGGAWINDPSGDAGTTTSDPAYESNGNATVPLSPAPVVMAWREPTSGAVAFTAGSC